MAVKRVRRVIDNGYNHHKVAWFEGGKIKTLKYPAILGSSAEVITDVDGGFSNMYQTDTGERFVVDPGVSKRISLRTSDYGVTDANRVLVNHGLKASGVKPDDEVSLVTSLPVRDFFNDDGTRNADLIDAQRSSMLRPVYSVLNNRDEPTRVANVCNSTVISEAVAAAFDYLVPNVGERPADVYAPIGVLDFGGSTFDVITLTKDLGIRQASSGTIQRGTMDIAPRLKRHLEQHVKELGINLTVPDWMINEVMVSGVLPYNARDADGRVIRKQLPVSDVIDEASAETVSEIKAFVKQLMPNFDEYQAILLVGGGSLLCRRLFSDWEERPNFFMMDEFANARGMLKIASAY